MLIHELAKFDNAHAARGPSPLLFPQRIHSRFDRGQRLLTIGGEASLAARTDSLEIGA